MKSIRKRLEYILVCVAYVVVPLFPRALAVALANAMGTLGYVGSPVGRRVGLENMDLVLGGEVSRAEKQRMLKRSFQVFALVLVDTFWFSRNTQARTTKWVQFMPGCESYFTDESCVSITAHIGNWEILGQAIAARGFPLASVATPLKNARVDRLFIEQRQRTGQKIVQRDGAIRKLARELKGGRKVALLLDQNIPPSDGGVFIDFFGLPVPVSPAAAMLARLSKCRIFLMMCLPQRDGSYMAVPAGEVRPEEVVQHDDIELTRQILGMTEAAIRKYPAYWLWTYKRWKYIPPDREPDGYPTYAHPIGPRRLAKAAP